MTLLRIQFAGEIRKVEHRTAGADQIVEFQLCRKNSGKKDDQPSFTWLRITLWKPAEWQSSKLVEGAFVAGCGDFQLRSYDKDGQKRQSAEVRCSSFDVEVGGGGGGGSEPAAAQQWPQRPARPAAPVRDAPAVGPGSIGEESPPFQRSELERMP